MDFTFILSNLHRFIRDRKRAGRRPDAEKNALFLTRAAVAGVLLVVMIAIMFTLL